MPISRFIVGMTSVLVVFAVTTYFMTHSLVDTLVQTIICAILIQAGYFVTILFLVRRERNRMLKRGRTPSRSAKPTSAVLNKEEHRGEV